MKTSYAFSLVTLVLGGALFGAASFVGCSGGDSAAPPVDTDTGVAETAAETSPPKDTGTPPGDTKTDGTPKLGCTADLPTDFACKTPTIPAGEKVCTEAAIEEFQTACFGGSGTACSAWQKKYAACNKCSFKFISASGWVENGYCAQQLAPTNSCGKLSVCNIDCYETVCADCDHTAGSGKTASSSEYQDCVKDAQFAGSASKPKGKCYDVVSKDLKAANCSSTDPISGCFDVVNFFRGACRDGADWTHMTDPSFGAGDAGSDGGSDAVGSDAVGDVAVDVSAG